MSEAIAVKSRLLQWKTELLLENLEALNATTAAMAAAWRVGR